MTNSELLLNYINYLQRSVLRNETIGRNIRFVSIFLESGYPVNRRGWQNYRKEVLVSKISTGNIYYETIEAMYDFMSFVEGKPKARAKKYKSLEKISKISELNQKLIADFQNFLIEKNNYSESTVRNYHISVRLFFEYCNDFTKENMRRFVATLEEKGQASQTIGNRIVALNKMAEYLKKPEMKLQVPSRNKRRLNLETVPSEKEYEQFLLFLKEKNLQEYYWVRVLASTGARINEFLQFTWEDIAAGVVELKGKGNKYRRFFFPKSLSKEIAEFAKIHNKSGAFVKNRMGSPMKDRGFAQQLKTRAAAAKLDTNKFYPHAFRHFFAKMYLRKSNDIVELADIMGHGNIETTRIYLQKSYNELHRDFNKNVTW